jgi:DNA-binding NtrC family response regulator
VRTLRTIVVIESEPQLRAEATEAFTSAGLQVTSFEDGELALTFLRSHKDDVEAILLDMDGCGAADGVAFANVVGRVCPTIAVIATGVRHAERPEGLDPEVGHFPKPWLAIDVLNAMQDIVLAK